MLLTPFDATGGIHWGDLDRLIAYELEHGVHGLAALGLGGEAGRLATEERLAVAERVLRAAEGVPVIVGATAQDTETACRLASHAAERGAAAVMVAPPSAPGIGRDTLRRHYLDVAAAAGATPIMVQDAPAYIGVALDAAFVHELAAARPNVQYAKTEAVPAGERTVELVAGARAGFQVFGGQAGLYYLDALDAGAVGVIPGCECPTELVAICEAHAAGRREEATELYRRILPLLVFEVQTLDFFIAASKELLHRQGVLSSSALRAPSPLGRWSSVALERHAASALWAQVSPAA